MGPCGALLLLLLARAHATSVCTGDEFKLDLYTSCQRGANHSNLGGRGPGTGLEELRFSKVGSLQGVEIDLVIVVLNASNKTYVGGTPYVDTEYTLSDAAQNGCNGYFGQINVKVGTSVTLDFQFQTHLAHKPYVLPSFEWTFLDIDSAATAVEVLFSLRTNLYPF